MNATPWQAQTVTPAPDVPTVIRAAAAAVLASAASADLGRPTSAPAR